MALDHIHVRDTNGRASHFTISSKNPDTLWVSGNLEHNALIRPDSVQDADKLIAWLEGWKEKQNKNQLTFKDLAIGQEFDFVSNTSLDSFFEKCKKISARCYSYKGVKSNRVGNIHAKVYHVSQKD